MQGKDGGVFGANSEQTQEAMGTAFGEQFADRINQAAGGGQSEKQLDEVRFGHPSGTLLVGGKTELVDGRWQAKKVSMSRSARRIMVGEVFVPADSF